MRGLGNGLALLAVIVAVVVGIILAIRALIGGLLDGLTSAKIADLLTTGIVLAVGIVALTRAGDMIYAMIVRGRQSQPRHDAPVIDGDYRSVSQLPDYRPQAQLPAPNMAPHEAFVAMHYVNGKTPGQVAVDRIKTRVQGPTGRDYDLTAKPEALKAAAAILRAGGQPVRTAFNTQGIRSSDDIRDAIAYLRAAGWIKPGDVGTPARWVDGMDSNSAEELEGWVSSVLASATGTPTGTPARA